MPDEPAKTPMSPGEARRLAKGALLRAEAARAVPVIATPAAEEEPRTMLERLLWLSVIAKRSCPSPGKMHNTDLCPECLASEWLKDIDDSVRQGVDEVLKAFAVQRRMVDKLPVIICTESGKRLTPEQLDGLVEHIRRNL